MAGPNKAELLTFFRAFGRWLDAPADPAALGRLITLHDQIRAAGEARPRVGRPAALRGTLVEVIPVRMIMTEDDDGTEEPRPAPVDDLHEVRGDAVAGHDDVFVQPAGDVT